MSGFEVANVRIWMWQMFGFEVANVRILVANGIKVGVGNDRLVKNTPSYFHTLHLGLMEAIRYQKLLEKF